MPCFEKKNIVAIFCAGESGVKDIVKSKYEDLSKVYPKRILDKLIKTAIFDESKYEELKRILSLELSAEDFIEVGEKGILAALYSCAKIRNRGLELKVKSIPVRQLDIEICEYYSINPYRLKSKMFCILSENSNRFIDDCQSMGVKAAHIGYVTKYKEKIIIDKEELQHIDKPVKDEIYKVLQ